jgi:hypothetical protein
VARLHGRHHAELGEASNVRRLDDLRVLYTMTGGGDLRQRGQRVEGGSVALVSDRVNRDL